MIFDVSLSNCANQSLNPSGRRSLDRDAYDQQGALGGSVNLGGGDMRWHLRGARHRRLESDAAIAGQHNDVKVTASNLIKVRAGLLYSMAGQVCYRLNYICIESNHDFIVRSPTG